MSVSERETSRTEQNSNFGNFFYQTPNTLCLLRSYMLTEPCPAAFWPYEEFLLKNTLLFSTTSTGQGGRWTKFCTATPEAPLHEPTKGHPIPQAFRSPAMRWELRRRLGYTSTCSQTVSWTSSSFHQPCPLPPPSWPRCRPWASRKVSHKGCLTAGAAWPPTEVTCARSLAESTVKGPTWWLQAVANDTVPMHIFAYINIYIHTLVYVYAHISLGKHVPQVSVKSTRLWDAAPAGRALDRCCLQAQELNIPKIKSSNSSLHLK